MVHVRRATAVDAPAFLALVRELAAYEKLEGPDDAAGERLVADAFGPAPKYDLWLATDEASQVVGYAVLCEQYSTFRARPVLYLEDLYVTPRARRTGAGRALMAATAREALARGCARLTWVVLDWNESAQRFYDELGAKRQSEWWPYVLEGDELRGLAGGESGPASP